MSEKLEIVITASDQASTVFHKVGSTLGTVFKVGLAGATVGLGLFTTGLGIAVNEAMEAEVNVSKLNAVIKSTGGVAGITSEEAQNLADSLSRVTRFSDDAILKGETMLLTFTNIGEDIFPQATEAALNMGEMFGSVDAAALQLGKALNDPIEGVGALRRVGVALTQQQEDQIKAMVEAGNVAGAQNVILKELEKEFGGVAKAAGATAAGQLTIFKNKLLNIAEGVGTTVLPIVIKLGSAIADKLIPFFEFLSRTVQVFVNVAGERGLAGAFRALFTTFKNGSGFFVELFGALGLGAETSRRLADVFNEFGTRAISVFEVLARTVQVFVDVIGERGVVGAFQALFTTFSDGSGFFVELFSAIGLGTETAQRLAETFNAIGMAVTMFVQEHLGLFINAFERIGAVLAGGLGMTIVTGLLTTLAGVIGALFSPIVLIIGAVTALSVAYDTNFMGMKDAVDAFASWFTGEAMPAIKAFIVEDVIPALQWLATELGDLWEKAKPKLQELALWFLDSALPDIMNFVTNDAIPALQWLWGELVNLWDKAEPKLSALFNWLAVEALPTVRDFLVNDVIPAVGDLRDTLMDVWDKAQPKLEAFYNFTKDSIGWLKENIFDPLVETITKLVDWLGKIEFPDLPDWLEGATDKVWNAIGLQAGGSFRGLAQVGEGGRELVYAPGGGFVFPNDMAERLLGAGGQTNNYTLNLQSNAGTERVMDDYALMQTLA